MLEILEMSVPVQLTNQEWSMILRLLKENAPKNYNRCIYKLEQELRAQLDKSFEVCREGLLEELFDYDPQQADTKELPAIRIAEITRTQEITALVDSASESDAPAYAEGDYLLPEE